MKTIKSAIQIFRNHPIFLFPLFTTWVFIAIGTVYFKWFFPWEDYNTTGQFIYAYLFYFLASLTVLLSCSVLVELIEQDESGEKMDMTKAIKESLLTNIGHIIILSFIWSIVWFTLVVLKVMFSKKDKNGDDELSAENIARTLAGNESFSWTNFTFDALIQALRMLMFIIVPAFAWENKNFSNSLKRGIAIVGLRTSKFIEGFIVSLGVQFFVYLPPAIMFYLNAKLNVEFSELAWYICIIYLGFAWSFTIYVEQLFGAELFLWQMKYEKAYKKAEKNGLRIPKFSEIERPQLLDEVYELKDIEIISKDKIINQYTPKSREDKLYLNFTEKSIDELNYIVSNKNKYQKEAIEIVNKILKEKNVGQHRA
jgi:hypothetical protein